MPRRSLCAWIIASAVVNAIVGVFSDALPFAAVSGTLYWLSLLLLWPDLSVRNRRQAVVLMVVALPGIAYGIGNDGIDFPELLAANNLLITLVIAVGFLKIVDKPVIKPEVRRGLGAFLANYLGIHFIGAVINYSAVVIFGDRMVSRSPLKASQALVLSRAFASAGFWSPFFVTIAVALNYATNSDYSELFLSGITLALITFAFTAYQTAKIGQGERFEGTDVNLKSLLVPLGLAGVIMLSHKTLPSIRILEWIIILCPLLAVLYSLLVLRDSSSLRKYVESELPKHTGELALFLSAGMLLASFAELQQILPETIRFDRFTDVEAGISYVAIVSLSLVGVHPIISVSVLVGLLEPSAQDNPNLIAFTILSGWAVSSAVSPLSGQNIGLQARHGIGAVELWKWHFAYGMVISIAVIGFIGLVFG